MKTYLVGSSNGTFVINQEGKILKLDIDSKSEEPYLGLIHSFDMDEWRRTYPKDEPEYIDILDLGYWTIGPLGFIVYECPDQYWRDELKNIYQDE